MNTYLNIIECNIEGGYDSLFDDFSIDPYLGGNILGRDFFNNYGGNNCNNNPQLQSQDEFIRPIRPDNTAPFSDSNTFTPVPTRFDSSPELFNNEKVITAGLMATVFFLFCLFYFFFIQYARRGFKSKFVMVGPFVEDMEEFHVEKPESMSDNKGSDVQLNSMSGSGKGNYSGKGYDHHAADYGSNHSSKKNSGSGSSSNHATLVENASGSGAGYSRSGSGYGNKSTPKNASGGGYGSGAGYGGSGSGYGNKSTPKNASGGGYGGSGSGYGGSGSASGAKPVPKKASGGGYGSPSGYGSGHGSSDNGGTNLPANDNHSGYGYGYGN